MADDQEDPREVPWHPRFAANVIGHDRETARFNAAVASGRPHHAWLMTGAEGIGKATTAYALARSLLALNNPAQTAQWIAARAHPDLVVLERSLNDAKVRKLRSEIIVDDTRRLAEFFARTSASGGWRIAIIDAVDDLNAESANALLKLVEEPPAKCLLLLVCHSPGSALRTLRSRCQKLPFNRLPEATVRAILKNLPLHDAPNETELNRAAFLCRGSPGRAIDLLGNAGAKAFDLFRQHPVAGSSERLAVANQFSARSQAVADYSIFTDLLLEWVATEAAHAPASPRSARLAELHAQIASTRRQVEGYNLDRRMAVIEALDRVQDALKAA